MGHVTRRNSRVKVARALIASSPGFYPYDEREARKETSKTTGYARAVPTTHEKALRVNVDAAKYGTFAEIGAGQEVARWFFRVGGAAGTIAKTISAYDTAVSDAIYGPSDRYVG